MLIHYSDTPLTLPITLAYRIDVYKNYMKFHNRIKHIWGQVPICSIFSIFYRFSNLPQECSGAAAGKFFFLGKSYLETKIYNNNNNNEDYLYSAQSLKRL